MTKVRLALCQMNVVDNKEENIKSASSMITQGVSQNADFIVTNIENNKNTYKVKFIEFSLEDKDVVLEIGEKTKSDLKDAKGNIIKTYDLEVVKGEEEGITKLKYTDGQKEVKSEDVEKFILDNKGKFIEKEMLFKDMESGLSILSCKVMD